jgi:hypothetical protein
MRCLKDQHEAGRPSSLWRSPTARPSMQGRHSTEHSRPGTVEWVCAPTCQVLPEMEPGPKWRSPANSWGRRPLDAAGLHRRKVWQTAELRLMASAAGPAKWRVRPSKKRHFAPFSLTFLPIFCRFFCEFSHQGAYGRHLAAKRADIEPCRLYLRLRPSPRGRVVGLPCTDLRPGCAAYRIKKWHENAP